MDHGPPNQFSNTLEEATSSVGRHTCELAERTSNGTHVRLLWRQGTRQVWVEVRERDDRMLTIPVEPERALDAFHHPYAFAGLARFRRRGPVARRRRSSTAPTGNEVL